uniref:Uncharacterized protein n=1 Tax=Phaeomonas parva TaxID=124430 RepID=A0A6U4LFR4_9STRA|mmetsp:Transcript_5597/g.15646  ORF Transcript_5597/g.15646 Transcript_5597/m.15646 type:complete len:199 (+) Transcript_5597:276-872(+)
MDSVDIAVARSRSPPMRRMPSSSEDFNTRKEVPGAPPCDMFHPPAPPRSPSCVADTVAAPPSEDWRTGRRRRIHSVGELILSGDLNFIATPRSDDNDNANKTRARSRSDVGLAGDADFFKLLANPDKRRHRDVNLSMSPEKGGKLVIDHSAAEQPLSPRPTDYTFDAPAPKRGPSPQACELDRLSASAISALTVDVEA